jgi:hypothetical protein
LYYLTIFVVPEVEEEKTLRYFRKWLTQRTHRDRSIDSLEDFEAYVEKMGPGNVIYLVSQWVGRKLAYAEIHEMAETILDKDS